MATNRTDSLIASSGGDYTTLQAWIDDIGIGLGTSTDLVTDDYDHYAWIAAEQFNLTSTVTFPAITADATHRLYIQADSNGGTSDASQHTHTKTDAALMDDSSRPLAYNSSYASFLCNRTYGLAFSGIPQYTIFRRLQFSLPGSSQRSLWTTASNQLVDRCLIQTAVNQAFRNVLAGNGDYNSSIIINLGTSQINEFAPGPTGEFYNCTIVRSSTSSYSATATQIDHSYQRASWKNCALFSGGAGTRFFDASGGAAYPTIDYNATDHSDLTNLVGEGSNNIYSLVQTNQFTQVNNTDWALKSGNDLATGGQDLTSTVPVDIFGANFTVGNIGCQAELSSGGQTVNVGFSDETDIALSIVPQQDLVVAVGLTLETDTSLDVSPIKDIIINIGLSEETDEALDVQRLALTDINTADEVDSALDILPIKDIIVNIGTSEETDTAFDAVPIKDILVSVGLSSETDTAFNVFAISEIGQGQEVDEALAVTPKLSGPITIQVNIASEADRALALVGQDQAGDKVISNIIFPIISNIILPIIR